MTYATSGLHFYEEATLPRLSFPCPSGWQKGTVGTGTLVPEMEATC